MGMLLLEQANELYLTAKLSTAPPEKRLENVKKAIACYAEALPTLEFSDDKAVCCKMYGKALALRASLCGGGDKLVAAIPAQIQQCAYYFREAASKISEALEHGSAPLGTKGKEWETDTVMLLREMVGSCFDKTQSIAAVEAMAMASKVDQKHARGTCYIELAQQLYRTAIQNWKKLPKEEPLVPNKDGVKDDHDGCRNLIRSISTNDLNAKFLVSKETCQWLHECFKPLNLAAELGWAPTEVNEIRDNVVGLLRVCDSVKARWAGDQMLYNLMVKSEGELNQETVLAAVDHSRRAVLLAEGAVVETEGLKGASLEQQAIGFFRLGMIFESILKMTERARATCLECVRVAVMAQLWPQPNWLRYATKIVEKYQQHTKAAEAHARQMREAREMDAQKARLQKEIETDIKEMDQKKSESKAAFLRYVHGRYSPHDPKHTLPEALETKEDLKKAVLGMFKQYHPDHWFGADPKVKLVYQEITKRLNLIYGELKGF